MSKLRCVKWLSELQDLDIGMIDGLARAVTVPAGTTVFRHGDPPDSLLVVIDGEVALDIPVSLDSPAPHHQKRVRAAVGLDDMSVIENRPRAYTVVAVTDLEILEIKRSEFDNLMATHPHIAMQIMMTIVKAYKPSKPTKVN